MGKKRAIVILGILAAVLAALIALAIIYVNHHTIAVLAPKGIIAQQQRHLMVVATLLMAVVVIPVFALTFGIAWRYRASNTKATYSPNLSGNRIAEAVWWLVPLAIISILAVIAWTSSHQLDPYKPLASNVKPLKVQVVALQWKWLFIYPDQHVASVNYLPLPTNTPIDFDITADAPMNSFWIPQLGGQVYAMSGMNTQLHLMATEAGDYRGSSANISGAGFAGMEFTAHATDQAGFDSWVRSAQQSTDTLTLDSYETLAKPSNVAPHTYDFPPTNAGLYDTVIMKYMAPTAQK